jgi:hypothetical protein
MPAMPEDPPTAKQRLRDRPRRLGQEPGEIPRGEVPRETGPEGETTGDKSRRRIGPSDAERGGLSV